jgi:hypothetical protein
MGGENRFLCPRNVPLSPRIDFLGFLFITGVRCDIVNARRYLFEDIGDFEGLLR